MRIGFCTVAELFWGAKVGKRNQELEIKNQEFTEGVEGEEVGLVISR